MILLLQTGGVSPVPDEVFIPKEKARIEKAGKVDGRIKVYTAASKRIQQTLEQAINKEDYQPYYGLSISRKPQFDEITLGEDVTIPVVKA